MIEAACYLPLNAAIIASLFLDYQTLPNTLHGVFTSLVVSCITRHLTKLSGKGTWKCVPHIESLDELPHEVENDFCCICLLAYQGIIKNQATFTSQDLQSLHPTLSSQMNILSLIQGTESFQRSILYNFLHLQIQELLAAFHISKLPPGEQVFIFSDLFGKSRFENVFEFYSAFTKLETEGIRDILSSMVTICTTSALISLLRCLYEAQDLSLCSYVVSLLEGELDLFYASLSRVDCLSVGYFLRCTCLTTTGRFAVDLRCCSLENYQIACLVRELSKCCNDRHVHLEIRLGTELNEAMNPDVVDKDVNRNVVDEDINPDMVDEDVNPDAVHTDIITPLLCCCCVFSLDILGYPVEERELYRMSCALATNSSLVKLNLSVCSLQVTDSNGPALTEMLKLNKTLQTLNMSENNGVADVGAFFIAEGLRHNRGLKHLELEGCGITAEGAKSIADALKVNQTLEHLGISRNTIGDTGVVHMAEALKSNNALKRLELSACGLTEKGLTILSASLVVNNSLQYLDISTISSHIHGGFTQTESVDCNSLKQFVSCLQENLHLTNLRLGPARDDPDRSDIVEDESSALNQVRRDKGLQELDCFFLTHTPSCP